VHSVAMPSSDLDRRTASSRLPMHRALCNLMVIYSRIVGYDPAMGPRPCNVADMHVRPTIQRESGKKLPGTIELSSVRCFIPLRAKHAE